MCEFVCVTLAYTYFVIIRGVAWVLQTSFIDLKIMYQGGFTLQVIFLSCVL
jgi:hypothetical protein